MKTLGLTMTDDQTLAEHLVSEETYLAMEMACDERHEYIDGIITAMAGESLNHNTIISNLSYALRGHLRDKPCKLYTENIKVRAATHIYYPDVVVDCAKPVKDEYFANQPVLVVEVLSSSTRKKDVTTKLMHYLNIPTLMEYVLVEQDVVRVQVLRKENQWQYEEFTAGDVVDLRSVGLTMAVVDIYEDVDNADIAAYRLSKP